MRWMYKNSRSSVSQLSQISRGALYYLKSCEMLQYYENFEKAWNSCRILSLSCTISTLQLTWLPVTLKVERSPSLLMRLLKLLTMTSGRSGAHAWAPDRPDVKIKNHGLGQYSSNPTILRYHFGNFVHWMVKSSVSLCFLLVDMLIGITVGGFLLFNIVLCIKDSQIT